MDCLEAEKRITYFIQDELGWEETEAFLNHLRSCEHCRRELETHFFLVEGLRMLDSETEEFDVKGTMDRTIRRAYQSLGRRRMYLIVTYVMQTLVTLSVAVSVLLMGRMWLEGQ